MKKVIQFLFASLYTLLTMGNPGSFEWIPIIEKSPKGNTVTCEVLEATMMSYKARIVVNGLKDVADSCDKGLFHHLYLDDYHHLMEVGAPSLPIITQTIAIPNNAKFTISIQEQLWKDLIIGTIYPFQGFFSQDRGETSFQINEETYSKTFNPAILNASEEMCWRGTRYVCIAICPFKYDANSKKLSVLSDFVLEVNFFGGNKADTTISSFEIDNSYRLFDNVVASPGITTYQSVPLTKDFTNSDNYDYLIIVGDIPYIPNSETMKRFRLWKAFKGLKTKIVSTSDIGTTDTSIRNYILQESSKGVKYVLFVGDDDKVPLLYHNSFVGENRNVIYGDYGYGCLDGINDTSADIAIGRFPSSSLQEFASMVNKTITYEKFYNATNQSLLMAAAPDFHFVSDVVYNSNFSEPISFIKAYGASIYSGGTNATNDSVLNAINQGANIINYRGHGMIDLWGDKVSVSDDNWFYAWNIYDEAFYSSEIDNMNESTCAIFFSVACNTGNIQYTSMLETFLRSTHGASAFIGSTMSSDVISNNTFNQLLFDKLLNDSIYRIGDVKNAAHIQDINYGYDFAKDNAYSYLCGGDPSLEIWTATPQSLGNIEITSFNDSVDVHTNITGSFYVCITSEDGELLQRVIISNNDFKIPKLIGNFYISINKHNYSPYVLYFDSASEFIQAKVIDIDSFYEHSPLTISDYGDPNGPIGDVILKSGTNLQIKNGPGGVFIESCFECEKGATLEIK